MPRYYFNIRKADALEQDPEGSEFPSLDQAYDEAVKAAREMLAEKLMADEVIDGQRFEITSADGEVLREVPFKSVLRLE
ncbi:MAG: hypothetical protein H5U11_19270 [Rhizobium sp.]|nr:hypothetical protein [Rhizobium sp.]